jgi:hypothetical protein
VKPIGGGKLRLFVTVGGVPRVSVTTFLDAMATVATKTLIFPVFTGDLGSLRPSARSPYRRQLGECAG